MTRLRLPVAGWLIISGLSLAAPASAQNVPAEKSGRYTLQPIDGGFLRMDTETGAMSLCTKRGAAVACEPVADQRASQGEVDRLMQENRALREDLKRLEELVTADGGKKPARGPKFEMPSEEDIDKAMSYVERMLKKFREKMKDLDQSGRGTL